MTHAAWLPGRDTTTVLLSGDASGRVVLTVLPTPDSAGPVHVRLDQASPIAALHKSHAVRCEA